MSEPQHHSSLDPVTFEVLKNSFITTVDQMAEQIIRTCHSFVIYNRDFSSGLNDAEGNSVAQGNMDIASHVGTLHYTCMSVVEKFAGDIRPGDVYMINDPYAGGTHFNDVRIVRPIFVEDVLIGFAQSNGHWTDVGGSVPGSFDVLAKEMFREGNSHTGGETVRRGQVPLRPGQHDRSQHPRSKLDYRGHEGAVGSDPGGGARAPSLGR